jgi:hypothetical protein
MRNYGKELRMLERIVVLVTIAALIACQMRCCDGQCPAANCCSSTPEDSAHESCSGGGACCCGRSTSADDEHRPRPAPKKPSCQGVCGGAVLAKPAELPNGKEMICLLQIDLDGTIATLPVARSSSGIAIAFPGEGNHGRKLRTLHMSFLC